MVLLGSFMVVMAHEPEQFAALPEADRAIGAVRPADATIRVGLARN